MTDQPYSDPVAGLFSIGEPEVNWPDISANYPLTLEHIPELIRMMTDEKRYSDELEDSETGDLLPETYANIHAWRALGELKAVEALPAMVQILPWADQFGDEWVGEELPFAIANMGPQALPVLAQAIQEHAKDNYAWAVSAAIIAIQAINENHPETASDAKEILAKAFSGYRDYSPEVNASLVVGVKDLRVTSAYPLVEEAFQNNAIEQEIVGDWEDFQVNVGLLEKRLTHRPNLRADNSLPNYSLSPTTKPNKAEKKEKQKRKLEKQSRKKNRKKKK
jgi:hypothetical protein